MHHLAPSTTIPVIIILMMVNGDDLAHLEGGRVERGLGLVVAARGGEAALQQELDHLHGTRCQILCSMRLRCVSKILTPCRMLKKTSLIAKINRWNNSFQNMYDML